MNRSPRAFVLWSGAIVALICIAIVFALNMTSTSVVHADASPFENSFEFPDTEEERQQVREFEESLQRPYVQANTLQQGIDALKRELKRQNLGEYDPLFTVDSVRQAIECGLDYFEAEYRSTLKKAVDKKQVAAAEENLKHFQENVKPVYTQIIEKKIWPPKSFFNFMPHKPLSVDLHIVTKPLEMGPGFSLTGFSLPIVKEGQLWKHRRAPSDADSDVFTGASVSFEN